MKTRRGSLLGGPTSSAPSPHRYIRGQRLCRDDTLYIRVNRDDLMNARRARVPKSCDDVPPISRSGPLHDPEPGIFEAPMEVGLCRLTVEREREIAERISGV